MHDWNNHLTDGAPIRRASGHGSETARLIRLAASGWDGGSGGLFADARIPWQTWVAGPFADTIGPHFLGVFADAGQMRPREIVAADTALDAALGDGAAFPRSRAAGAALLASLVSARSSRLADRLLALCPQPHLPTAAAIQAVEFHLPLRQALFGYLYLEFSGSGTSTTSDVSVDAFLGDAGGLLAGTVSRLLARSAGSFSDASHA